jgi:hypothetical protein
VGFAPTLKEVFDSEGIADAVNFKLSPGIRGPEHTGSGFSCVDESGCDEEVMFLCAQNVTQASVHCLAAMDATSGDAAAKGKACATAESSDYSKIEACFKSDLANTLKSAAALYFDGRFPKPVGVPHIEINGQAQDDRSKASLISALCATGISAGACKSEVVV